eukprot:3736647-Pleurochrysis_carterae.AAC.1
MRFSHSATVDDVGQSQALEARLRANERDAKAGMLKQALSIPSRFSDFVRTLMAVFHISSSFLRYHTALSPLARLAD